MSASVTLSEHESKRILADHGLRVADERLAADAEEAVTAAEALGGTVVLKLCGPSITHKTERNLVRLGLLGADAVAYAAEELLGAARAEDGDVSLLVAQQVSGRRELIIGVVVDPQFGPTIMLGFGGILAEAIADTSFRLVPITERIAADMIDDLRFQTMLGPFRGEPAVDRAELVAALMAVAAAAETMPDLESLDVNPLIVVDGVPVAVDALIIRRAP